MSLDCVMEYVVKPLSCFVYSTGKDYVSYIRSYDANINFLIEELQNLQVKKEELKSKVSSERKNLKNITLSAKIWLKKVSILSQNEELKKLVVYEEKIAEKVFMLMEEKDLKKVLREGDEIMIGVVIRVMMELHDDDDDDETKEFKKRLKGDVLEVLKETTHKFKKMITEDIKVAMIMMTILKDEDVVQLSQGNEETVDMLEKWKKMFEEESSEIHDYDESSTIGDVVNLVRPFEKLLKNDDFMKDLPKDMKLEVKMMDDLWKGQSAELKDQSAIEKHKDKYGRRHHCCYYFKHFHHRYEMSKLAEKMAKVIKPLYDNPPTSVTLQINIEDREDIPSGFVVGVKSREQCLQLILTKLRDDQVNCVGVYGMGGIGKSTLVKEVKSRAKANFDKIALVVVSESPNIESIQGQVAEELDLSLIDVHSTGPRAQKLYNMLFEGNKEKKERDQGERKGKTKILIILDNMWHKLNLSEVGIPYVSTNEFCCKILVTSRDKNVCELMGIKDDNIIKLDLLNENESKKLFQHHVKKTIDEGDYKSVAEKLLKKCNRLPLNIMTTANVLKEKDLSTWQHFVDELEKPTSSEVSSVRRETYKILETSYKFLESEEKKTFFLLACLSPLDSSISVDNLMRYGVGLDLFQNVDKLSEALDQASKWVSELVSSSLLLKDDDSLSHVKIHDDVRESAMSFAEKGKQQQHKFLVKAIRRWMCKESFNKYTGISLLSRGHDFSRLNAVKAELLQILLLKGNTSELADGFFQGMPNLKVLHLSCMTFKPQLPASVVELKNLKTLQLEHCKLGDISLMCKLIELIVVSLRNSSLEELPAEMGKLVNLRILDMGGCSLKSPTNTNVIARLSSLEGLYLFDKFNESATDHEFNELPHLNFLKVVYLLDQNNYSLIHLPLSRFFEHLDRFSIVFAINYGSFELLRESFSASPSQHRALQFMGSVFRSVNFLDIQAFCLKALLKRTEFLLFLSINLKKNLVPDLDKDGFMDLKHLEVSHCKGMECVISTDINGSNNLIAFQNLEYLKLGFLEDLKMICKGNAPPGSKMFSNLRHLELNHISNLEYALPLAPLPRNLTEIKIFKCLGMKFIFNDNDYSLPSDGSDHYEKVVIDLPLLKLLSIDSSDVVSLVGPVAKADAFFNTKIKCPSLELLEVDSCATIMYLWSKELDISSFQNLKELNIKTCDSLQNLGSASVFCALVQLESMTVRWCEGLQTIITEDTEEQKTIEFRQLRELELNDLGSLKSFCGGSYRVKFPKLKKLEMRFLRKLTTFVGSVGPSTTLFSDKVEFPYLEELEVIGVMEDTNMQLWNWDGAVKNEDAPKLRKVKIDSIKGLKSIPNIILANIYSLHLKDVNKTSTDKVLFALSPSEVVQQPKLEELYVKSFSRLKTLFESEDNDGNSATAHENGMLATYCRQLKQLTLEDLPELSPTPLHFFKNLRSLKIIELNWKYIFPSDVVVRSLEMLEELTISSCGKLDVIMPDEKEGGDNDIVVMFPRLKTMRLICLNIHSFSTRSYYSLHFSSLETLEIYKCSKLEAFWSGPGPFVAPKLKKLHITRCNNMKWFLSGELTQVELLSLQQVQIDDAPCMKLFSATPLKAPKLREVSISNCRDMDWILPGYPNHDDVLHLPSLVKLSIYESKLQTFSTGPLKAPKLTHARINGGDFDIGKLEFKQFLEGYKPKKDNKDEGDKQESKHKSEEEIQESTYKEENRDKENHEQIQ